MKTKAKINSVLVKKLEEIESLVEDFNDNNDPNLYRKIQLRVIFATTVLTAEIRSRPIDMEGEEDSEERLKRACMAKRLAELSDAFSDDQLSVHDNGSLIEPDMVSLETNARVVNGDTGSVYSWVESCQDEFDKAEEEEEDAKQWPLFRDASLEEKIEVTFPVVAADKEGVVVREMNEKRRLGFRALVCFCLIGLVGGMIFGYLGDIIMKDDHFFLTPT